MPQFDKKGVAKKSVNISEWYNDVVLRAELADYAPVKGCMVIRPYGYALWESIQSFLDKLIKERGVQNAYFPIFIPEKFLEKEKEHVEGFSPHLAVVTIAGGEKLKERLVVRPTSETVMYDMYKKWTQSWRDLPILINQWNNIVRWEKRTYLFLRTSEFLWQEGHCAHLTPEENMETVLWALRAYEKTYNELMAMYGIPGVKSNSEKFAGGDKTYSFEMLMPDGKALQSCTSHDLGQNFAKAFDWTVLDKSGEKIYPWQNSWGFSTRSIGGLILAHGDDQGIVLPPNIAPIQVIIIPIKITPEILNYCTKLKEDLEKNDIRVKVDDRDSKSVGWKFNEWELKGVPVRIEIGEKEMTTGELSVSRRDDNSKLKIPFDSAQGRQITQPKADPPLAEKSSLQIKEILENIQKTLFAKMKKFTLDNTHSVDSYEEFKKIMETTRGFIKAMWCENPDCEKKIKEETKATTRILPLDSKDEKGSCIYCKKEARNRWLFAQAY